MKSVAQLLTYLIDSSHRVLFRRVIPRQLYCYACCGGLNLVLDALWYYLIYHYIVGDGYFLNLGFVVMSAPILTLFMVFPITFFTGFWLNRNVAFRRSPLAAHTQLLRYAISVVGAILLNYLCMRLLVYGFALWPTPAKLVTSLISALYSFLVAKCYTFKGAID